MSLEGIWDNNAPLLCVTDAAVQIHVAVIPHYNTGGEGAIHQFGLLGGAGRIAGPCSDNMHVQCFMNSGLQHEGDIEIDVNSHPAITRLCLSLIHISEPTRLGMISYAVFCLKKK